MIGNEWKTIGVTYSWAQNGSDGKKAVYITIENNTVLEIQKYN